jgi:hypothetical protein
MNEKNLGVALMVLGFGLIAIGGYMFFFTDKSLVPISLAAFFAVQIGSGFRRQATKKAA